MYLPLRHLIDCVIGKRDSLSREQDVMKDGQPKRRGQLSPSADYTQIG